MMNENKKTAKKVMYRLPHNVMGTEIVNKFAGKAPLILVELTDENGRIITNENELTKRGATFGTIVVERDLSGGMVKKHRETGEDNPFIDTKISRTTKTATERYSAQVMLNCIWQNVVDNKREKTEGTETGFQAKEERVNGIVNYLDSRVICHKVKDENETFYLNYVVLRYVTERTVTDENGNDIDIEYLNGFLSKTKAQKDRSRQREADKHGIELEFDPQIRQMKFENIKELRVFNSIFIPSDMKVPAPVTV